MTNIALPSRLKEADGIRGLACMIVLIQHSIVFAFPSINPYLRGTAKIGVWLFFSLSSFLLTYQLLLRGFSVKTLIDYFLGRTLRIYPLFVLAVLAYYFFKFAGINTATDVINAITFQKGYAHLWTIPVEFKFYFFLPIFVFVGNLVYLRFGWKGILATGLFLTIIHQLFAPYWLLKENTISTFQYLPSFLFGIIGAILQANNQVRWVVKRSDLIGGIILVGVLVSTPFMRYFLLKLPPSEYLVNQYLFFSLAWTIFICSQIHSYGFLSSLLVSRLLSVIGLCSYSIYLIHWLILSAMVTHHLGSLETVIVGVVASIAVGYLMYTFLEKPLFAARKHLLAAFDNNG